MASRKSGYRNLESVLTKALVTGAIDFIVYMIAAGTGLLWLKVITAVAGLLIGLGVLALLFLSKELLKPRSIWMTISAIAIVMCLLVSLIVNYPSPNPYKNVPTATVTTPIE